MALVTAAPAGRAAAVPIDEPHVGGIGFSGPTTGDLAAIYWNPAALGLMHGLNVTFAGNGRFATTTVSRAPIDPVSGRPGPGVAFPQAKAVDRSHPFTWPPGPGAFAGISYDVGGDRLTLAAAVYMPFLERTTYQSSDGDAAGALPTRYHRISSDLRNLSLSSAFAVRLAGDFRFGIAPNVLLSTGRMSFAESTCSAATPCTTAEDPAHDAVIDVGSNQGMLSSKASVTLTTGLYYRRRTWEAGLSFTSRPFAGQVGASAVIVGDQSHVSGAPFVFADIVYKLPYILTAGVSWHPRSGWEITAIERLLSFPAGDVIDIRLTGENLDAAHVPAHIVLYRGYGTVLDSRLRVSNWVREWMRVGVGLRYEGSALPARAVSPATVDNGKLEPTAMVLIRLARHLWLAAGYGFTYMLPVSTSESAFDPTAARTCADARGDLNACLLRNDGLARPSAAGSYRHFEHDLSLSVTAQF